jgi:hypothetical protein
LPARACWKFQRDDSQAEKSKKCFGFVQSYDGKPRRRLFDWLKSQGMAMNPQVTWRSDGTSLASADRPQPGAADLDTLKTILGYQRRPRYRTRKRRSTEWEVTVEKPTYDLTIFQLLVAS